MDALPHGTRATSTPHAYPPWADIPSLELLSCIKRLMAEVGIEDEQQREQLFWDHMHQGKLSQLYESARTELARGRAEAEAAARAAQERARQSAKCKLLAFSACQPHL